MPVRLPGALAFCLVILALTVTFSPAAMSQNSEVDQVKAANASYYAALSARNISAMEKVWSRSSRDVNVAPPIKPAAHVGWDTIRKNYLGFWSTLDELTVLMPEPHIEIHGSVAWVYGIEHAKRKAKSGQASEGPNFGTSIFINEGGRWLMVFHQAALIPAKKQ
jgi:ketosteroid isomerase-like protein